MHYMELGGAERALLGMLYAIDTTKYEVDLFVNQHTGPFMSLIPKNINLLPENPSYASIECPITQSIQRCQFGVVVGRLIAKIKYKRYLRKNNITNDGTATHFVMDNVIRHLPSLKKYGHYDLAISYLDPPHIVQDKVDADVKVEWIHTDFSGKNFHYDEKLTFDRWNRNNFIMSISDSVTDSFISKFPSLKVKIVKMENIIPQKLIIEQSRMYEPEEYKGKENILKICSVGRIGPAKNFECIPIVAKMLKVNALRFYWHIIGPGDTDTYNKMATENDVADCVQFLGGRDNPYPYMAGCDIYIQPSRFEGKAVTVQEAQMLAKPVIITRYPTSASQIVDGIDGIICEMDNESIANAIITLAADIIRMAELGANATKMHCGNNEEIKKLLELL